MSLLLNSTTAKTSWNIDPRTIPDCLIWFDAADTSTLTLDGNTVKAWKNKGSIDMNAIQDTGTCTSGNTINGLNYITCPAGAHLGFTCALTIQARSVFVVARNTTQLTGSNFWGMINQTAGAGQMAVYVSRSSATATTYPADMGPSGFGANGVSSGANGSNPFGQVNLFAFVQSSTRTADNAVTINGTPSMTVSNLAGNYNVGTVKYVINTAGYNTGSDICEILYYSRDVSVIERQAIEGYLMWKWGIKRQNEIGFTPTSISNCAVWYDADVNFNDATSRATSFTFSSGNLVNVWKDKSGNARDATFLNVSPSTTRPTLTANQVNGNCAVVFNGANALESSYSLPTTQAHTLFVVAGPNANGFRSVISLNARPGTRGQQLNVYVSGPNTWWYSGGDVNTDGNTASIAYVSNRYDILAFYWSTTLRTQMNINGHFIPSSTASPASLRAGSTMLIGSATINSTPYELFSGGIAEIILYTDILTVDQRNQVERYLSLKWNRPLVNACPIGHPNKLVPAFTQPFPPLDIGSCIRWFDASDQSTVTRSGTTVTQWRDKSGRGDTTSGGTFNANGTLGNSLSTVSITGAIFTVLPLGISGASPTSLVMVGKSSSTSVYSTWIRYYTSGTTGAAYARSLSLDMRADAVKSELNQVGGTVAIGGLTTTKTKLAITTHTGAKLSLYESGTFAGSSVNALNQIDGNMRINPSGTLEIGEFMVFDKALTSGERQALEGYLAAKWGLRANLPATHPSYFVPGVTDVGTFTPTSITGCSLWLDASDTSTINSGVGIAAGGEVATWADKSGNASVTGNLGTSQCIWNYSLNRLPSITMNKRFVGSFSLSPLTNFQHTTFIVSSLNSNPTAGYPCFQMATNGTTNPTNALNALDFSTTFRTTVITGGTSYPATRPATALSTAFLWRSTYDGISALTIRRNSDSADIASVILGTGMPTTNATTFYIGGRFNDGVATWPGNISEIIVYNTVLSAENALVVEKYLARKWGLTQIIPAANRFTNPVPIPNTPRFFPSSLENLTLWLDATDPYANGVPPASGTSLARWVDKSSTRASFTTVNAFPTYTTSLINGLPGIDMTNSSGFISNATQTLSSSLTLAMVVVVKSGIGAWAPFFTHGSRDLDLAFERNAAGTTLQFQSGNDNAGANLTYTTDQVALYLGTMTTGTSRFFSRFGGGTTNTATGTNTSTITVGLQTIRIGINDAGDTTKSFIGEVVYYNRVLSIFERQQLEGYLTWKWGISGSLPTSHPYYKVRP
jgi:hypothetical protein